MGDKTEPIGIALWFGKTVVVMFCRCCGQTTRKSVQHYYPSSCVSAVCRTSSIFHCVRYH